ncbi:MAG TPA: hypothetical protein VGR91_03440 [Stellaceae bacterium]|nr:hypothetical protein [Stellaceae bacterium]
MPVSAKKYLAALVAAATFAAGGAALASAQSAPLPPPLLPQYEAPYYPPYRGAYAPDPGTYEAPFPLSLLAYPIDAAVLPFSFLAGYGPYPYSP